MVFSNGPFWRKRPACAREGKPPTVQHNVLVFFSFEQIDPVDHCKTDKIQSAAIAKFIFPAHAESYTLQILLTTYL